MNLPLFETNRLILRAVELKDWQSYEKNFADYEVIEHLSHHVPWPYPPGSVKTFLEDIIFPDLGVKRWLWVILLKNKPEEVIGCVDLWRNGCPENRGFWLARKHWGKGLMSEAVVPVMNYAFNELGFEKLIFANAVGNLRSRRIIEKTGAKFIETRAAQFVNPKYTEHEIWELTKENWEIYKINEQSFNLETYVGDDLKVEYVKPQEAHKYVQSLKDRLPRINSVNSKVKVLGNLGMSLLILKELELAERYLCDSLDLIKIHQLSPQFEVQQSIRLANVYQWKKQFSKANDLFKSTIKSCQNNDECRSYLDFALQHFGKCLFDQKDYEAALLNFEDALEIRRTKDNDELIKSTEHAISVTKKKFT